MTDANNNHAKIDVVLLAERQRQMLKRLDEMETRYEKIETMVNRYIGGIALLVGVGVLAGWWMTIKGGLPLFR